LTDFDALRRHEHNAWDALTSAHRPGVFRLAYLMLGDAADAEDVTQETFLRAVRAIDSFDPAREMRPWLFAIAANLARNQRRGTARWLAALQRWLFHEGPAAGALVIEARVEAQVQAARLWQAVRRLPQTDQEVIYLRYFLDVSEAEVGQIQGVAIGTVKSRAHRAMARLRAVIASDFPDLQEGRAR
jgi:RNA polymerase sigma-70 factor, ECF subfamily